MKPYKIIAGLLTALTFASCTKDFDSINTNPNSPSVTRPEYHLTEAITQTAYAYAENGFARRPAALGRYITLIRNNDYELFRWTAVEWSDIYQRAMIVKTMQQEATSTQQPAYVAAGKVLMAFNFAYLTDLYGDVPYSKALQSVENGNIKPTYDKQEDIYNSLLALLKEANTELKNNGAGIDAKADAMFAGDALKWRKLANSLRLRLLLRCAKKYPAAWTEMQEILNNKTAYPIMESNADNAEVPYLGVKKDDSWAGGPLNMIDNDFLKTKASKELVDALLSRNDPRLELWIAPVASTEGATIDKNKYVGIPHAYTNPGDYNGGESHQSTLSSFFRQNKPTLYKASLMLYTEVCFIAAEAMQQGKVNLAGNTAESMYNNGIKSSLEYYGLQAEAQRRNYYEQPVVKYNGTLEQLITQKWLAMTFRGAEGWFDFRRTGYPAFVVGPMAYQKTFPVRYAWPSTEQDVNIDNYRAAINAFGADDINTKMWYLR
ncbi:SusD/RagB family nutrient-binding outer membrane lipoprotein [Chitinophaga nivalis]|uniref:SusD/RagB family nutrient-binding outer membrane lipoprotein n=1 Tax=Chitinophaga nivalis TaxID=2991709 RepID=A0ABT3IM30_9BACT|nr:SusD/RagB family nutrient-binding outer membrane lipoprotein [Chitinophaga nivalis]MCW3465287.1 SusD/RagB family nutrient-binding outer membrane lipoprotein [Chitinophaga nivalis]MCW3485021.1 SusD/RagB family nutrient-binding outer membrane lipoprotein [Chitinophaga nivalis]